MTPPLLSEAVLNVLADTTTAIWEGWITFVSTRIITSDVNRLVGFYEMVTGVPAVWGNGLFAEIPTSVGTLAIGSDKTVPLFGNGSAEPAANRSEIVEFIVRRRRCRTSPARRARG